MVGRFLVFLGGVIVVVLFVALLAPLFIDWTDFRKNFEDQASRIIGKKVTVHAEQKVDLYTLVDPISPPSKAVRYNSFWWRRRVPNSI